jgi:predicted nucleotidyltransferase component of viral defense system
LKDYLVALLRAAPDPITAQNLLREYFHARLLGTLEGVGAMIPLAFHGGASLRFLYSIPRFSYDLDFALEQKRADYDFRAYLKAIQADFAEYTVNLKVSDQKVVHSAFVRFPGSVYRLAP